jgi:hypothetical protein
MLYSKLGVNNLLYNLALLFQNLGNPSNPEALLRDGVKPVCRKLYDYGYRIL